MIMTEFNIDLEAAFKRVTLDPEVKKLLSYTKCNLCWGLSGKKQKDLCLLCMAFYCSFCYEDHLMCMPHLLYRGLITYD